MILVLQKGTANPFIQYSHQTNIEKMIKTAKEATKNKNNTLIKFIKSYLSVSYIRGEWWSYNDNGLNPKPFKRLKNALKDIGAI